MKLCLFALVFFLKILHLGAEEIDVSQSLRIDELIPQESVLIRLAVDPAVPAHFVALSKPDDPVEWIYWGPKDVLTAYFEDPLSLSEPIIRFKFAMDLMQNKEGCLDEKAFREHLSKINADTQPTFDFGKWGSYPYCKVSVDFHGANYFGYVGLNDDSGAALLFHLVIPQKSRVPIAALNLWEKFFRETKELPEPLFFKAHGQEMHPGYTIVNILGHKVKVTVEKRKSDHRVLLHTKSLDDAVDFEFKEAFETTMGAKWHHKKPLLKIKGVYLIKEKNFYYEQTASVLINEVDEFSTQGIIPLLKVPIKENQKPKTGVLPKL